MNGIEAISTGDQSWATLVPAIRVASTEMEDLNEAHELSKRQSETGGSQKRKGLGVLVERSGNVYVSPERMVGSTIDQIASRSAVPAGRMVNIYSCSPSPRKRNHRNSPSKRWMCPSSIQSKPFYFSPSNSSRHDSEKLRRGSNACS